MNLENQFDQFMTEEDKKSQLSKTETYKDIERRKEACFNQKIKQDSPWYKTLQAKKGEIMEKDIEKAFCKYAESKNCKAIKFVDPTTRGAPDRLVLLPKGKVLFIEFKTSTGRLSEHQVTYHKALNGLGLAVFICKSTQEAIDVLNSRLRFLK